MLFFMLAGRARVGCAHLGRLPDPQKPLAKFEAQVSPQTCEPRRGVSEAEFAAGPRLCQRASASAPIGFRPTAVRTSLSVLHTPFFGLQPLTQFSRKLSEHLCQQPLVRAGDAADGSIGHASILSSAPSSTNASTHDEPDGCSSSASCPSLTSTRVWWPPLRHRHPCPPVPS